MNHRTIFDSNKSNDNILSDSSSSSSLVTIEMIWSHLSLFDHWTHIVGSHPNQYVRSFLFCFDSQHRSRSDERPGRIESMMEKMMLLMTTKMSTMMMMTGVVNGENQGVRVKTM